MTHKERPPLPDHPASGCPVAGHPHAPRPGDRRSPAAAPEDQRSPAAPRGEERSPRAPRGDGGCPIRPSPEGWSEEALAHVRERARASGMDTARAEELSRNVAEERARRRQQEITQLFLRTLGRRLGYGHPLSDRTGELRFTWTAEAEGRLAEVPEFCRELTRWRVEWTAHKLGLGDVITPEVMDVKYEMWGRVSHAIEERRAGDGLPWTEPARARFDSIPPFVRGQVLEAIEGNARSQGATLVDDRVIDAVIERWVATGDFHEGLYGFR